ncbi:hypothetical protein OEZ71_14615 [Defluviimonas sp. WL0050]|uniref:Uncharacterized protein n=1 Tax=Albidovulum litorale TaxID=2984134 RepID=A0ABT2ZQU9_9RHOB|nr:hypothetical protein [Defluviimonas sp. WL0050]MCV2873531.1 hypothetical protein [Defluviimonas sp. WL0050]
MTVTEMADDVAGLIEARLRIRGEGLAEKLRRGGRLLPRKVRREAEYLLHASEQDQIPKLRMQLDQARIANAYHACLTHLKPLGALERRRALFLDVLESAGFAVFAVLVATVLILIWWL